MFRLEVADISNGNLSEPLPGLFAGLGDIGNNQTIADFSFEGDYRHVEYASIESAEIGKRYLESKGYEVTVKSPKIV